MEGGGVLGGRCGQQGGVWRVVFFGREEEGVGREREKEEVFFWKCFCGRKEVRCSLGRWLVFCVFFRRRRGGRWWELVRERGVRFFLEKMLLLVFVFFRVFVCLLWREGRCGEFFLGEGRRRHRASLSG